ncbi:MAG: hypothetical protein SVY10_17815 [Thermodesulfobacteriota bacterium]|nr:hypothetical protein [Thermodesulfobacteriota bacterium]
MFEKLSSHAYETYINIGLESSDQDTLDLLEKPLTAMEVKSAFQKARDINKSCQQVNGTSDFVLRKDLPRKHMEAVKSLVSQSGVKRDKGTIIPTL